MVQLYDWAGSFTPVPKHYYIICNMRSTNEPLDMSYNGTVAFLEFGFSGNIPQLDLQDSITHKII